MWIRGCWIIAHVPCARWTFSKLWASRWVWAHRLLVFRGFFFTMKNWMNEVVIKTVHSAWPVEYLYVCAPHTLVKWPGQHVWWAVVGVRFLTCRLSVITEVRLAMMKKVLGFRSEGPSVWLWAVPEPSIRCRSHVSLGSLSFPCRSVAMSW